MAITTAFTTRAKRNLLRGDYQLLTSGGDVVKAALYVAAAVLGAATLAYSASDEVANGNGYTTGGQAVTIVDPAESGTTAFIDFADLTWPTASFTARGVLFYDDTESGKPSLSVHDFGADKTSSAGDFILVMPTPDASSAILRLA